MLEPVLTDGQVLGAMLLLTLARIDMRRWPKVEQRTSPLPPEARRPRGRPRRAGPKPLGKRELRPTERTCTECGTTKPLTAEFFLPIARGGFYGRCRVCRNKRARERYHSTSAIRAAEIARAQKNYRSRIVASLGPIAS